jgi:hypothetical protein
VKVALNHSEMSKFVILWWTFLLSSVTEGSRNSRILITEGDPRALTFYEGPGNVYRPGRPLPSLIIKSKRNIGSKNPYEHLEYQKPVWDEDDKLRQFSLVRIIRNLPFNYNIL